MEQMRQNEAGALTAQAIPQKDVEQACFHALGLIGRNCEYLDQHLAHVGADQQTRQAVNDISAAAAGRRTGRYGAGAAWGGTDAGLWRLDSLPGHGGPQ